MTIARVVISFGVAGLLGGCLSRPLVEASPETSNVYVDQVVQAGVDKIDLLFMVDNSASMADKQEILRDAVPVLVKRLTSPICVDSVGALTGENSVDGKCTRGEPEFTPIADIHVGIVTSSLGAHGGTQACADEKAHLLGTLRSTGSSPDPKLVFDVSQTWNNSGFLAWDSNRTATPPGADQPDVFKNAFQDMIQATGEHGCGFEASLESWYRFLIDPEPPAKVTRDSSASSPQTARGSALLKHADGSTSCEGCDLELLEQRRAFLRPDSLVAIVMLSDENDCSIRDDGAGWLVASSSVLPRATSACDTNPNDVCCRSCGQRDDVPPPGCAALAGDASCQISTPRSDDAANVRCFKQRSRFGFDLLYPTSRYVSALTSKTLTLQSDGKTQVPNPLYSSSPHHAPRESSLVFLAGIVGVPWQDIADDASLHGPGLKYLTAAELVAKDRWKTLLGDASAAPPTPPADPFMIESIAARAGDNPITGDPIVAATATNPEQSPINGHEQHVPKFNDLQYACTFPLATPRPCAQDDVACDCSPSRLGGLADVTAANSPLCQPVSGGAPTAQQNFAKAYPGTRELEVLKDLQDHGIVASICPKLTHSTDPASDPNYGYNPAVGAIIERLTVELRGRCLPRAVEADPTTHQVLCKVIEAQAGPCDCQLAGRGRVDASLLPAVERQLNQLGRCDVPGQPACSSFCACEIVQERTPAEIEACRQGQGAPPGFCYLDDPASPALKNCPANQKRLLRFVDSDSAHPTPARDAVALIACIGAPLHELGTGGTGGE
jgi:hypothetical protein